MLPLRFALRWQLAGAALLLMALVASLLPEIPFWPDVPGAAFTMSDKVLHILAFLSLTVWFSGQYPRAAYWRIAAGLIAFGALIEVLQGLTDYRDAEWLVLTADGIGIVIGLAVAILGAGGWSQRLEHRIADR